MIKDAKYWEMKKKLKAEKEKRTKRTVKTIEANGKTIIKVTVENK